MTKPKIEKKVRITFNTWQSEYTQLCKDALKSGYVAKNGGAKLAPYIRSIVLLKEVK